MIRDFHLADLFTLGNAASGMGSILSSMAYMQTGRLADFLLSAAMGPVALFFDAMDGHVARWRHKHSLMGRELDSLADVISFGVAPAALGYAAGLRGGWDCAILMFFVACGVSRLARFNVTAETLSEGADKVPYFEGAPIPTTLSITLVLAMIALSGHLGDESWLGPTMLGPFRLHLASVMYLAHGCLMISKTIRIPKP